MKSDFRMKIALFYVFVVVHVGQATECSSKYGGQCHDMNAPCPEQFNGYSVNFCGFLQQCCFHKELPPYNHTGACTKVTSPGTDRIVGGQNAHPGQYPWMVSVQYDGNHICGGTLIDQMHVLTAAHCFLSGGKEVNRWSIVFGLTDISSVPDLNRRQAAAVYPHRGFTQENPKDDVAVVRLRAPVPVSSPVAAPACLPPRDEDMSSLYCTVVGWGAQKEGGPETNTLKSVRLPLVSRTVCRYYLKPLGFDVTDKVICAGYESGGLDACTGDSGGPMVCERNGTWEVAGVVSLGKGCAQSKTPGVYTRVSQYLPFIQAIIAGGR